VVTYVELYFRVIGTRELFQKRRFPEITPIAFWTGLCMTVRIASAEKCI
jgi:hypothetical protein